MILFFRSNADRIYAVGTIQPLQNPDIQKLTWLFGNAEFLSEAVIKGPLIGPRKEMVTPWSTNAVEITQNMGIKGIIRIEEFVEVKDSSAIYDRMLQHM